MDVVLPDIAGEMVAPVFAGYYLNCRLDDESLAAIKALTAALDRHSTRLASTVQVECVGGDMMLRDGRDGFKGKV